LARELSSVEDLHKWAQLAQSLKWRAIFKRRARHFSDCASCAVWTDLQVSWRFHL